MKIKALKTFIYCLSPLLCLFVLCSFKSDVLVKTDTTKSSGFKVRTIIVDAGHGGKKTGADGAYSLEKNVTLAISFKLQKAIEKDVKGVKVVMTRTNDDDVGFQERADIANNNKGDLFISIHCNSLSDKVEIVHGKRIHVPDRSGKGVLELVYLYRRDKEQAAAIRENLFDENDGKGVNFGFDPTDPAALITLNAFKAKYRKNSIRFANLVNDEFVDNDGRKSGGVVEESIHVLCNTAMPSVLVETGFINNPDDEAYLNSEDGQNEIVASIVRAIIEYKKEVE